MSHTILWRCLVVEDDPETARFVADGFRAMGHVVVLARDGPEALARLDASAWDLVILDRMLPQGVDGLSILAHLRALGRQTPVLVLSALDALDERVRGLKAGGDDYLTKPFAFSELAARAEALVRRSQPGDALRVLALGNLRLDLARRQADCHGRVIALQPREFRLLAYLMLHPGRPVTRTMLLESVWDLQFDPQTNVIDVQISRVRSKLAAEGASVRLVTLRGVGYRLEADDAPAGGDSPHARHPKDEARHTGPGAGPAR